MIQAGQAIVVAGVLLLVVAAVLIKRDTTAKRIGYLGAGLVLLANIINLLL